MRNGILAFTRTSDILKLCGDKGFFSVFINSFFCSYFTKRGEKDAEENFTLLVNNFDIE